MSYQFEKSGKLKTFTDAELAAADANSSIIVTDEGIAEDGRPCWLYIAVKPSKYEEYIRLCKERKPKRFNEFGTVLKFGYGKHVPAEIKEEMKQKYGCDDNYVANLVKDIKAAQAKFIKKEEDKKIGDIVAMMKMKKIINRKE